MTSKPTNKKPKTTKPEYKREYVDLYDPNRDPSTIHPELQKELDEQGLVGRWISAKEVFSNNGWHKRGWIPYKRKQCDTMSKEFAFQGDPDGLVRNKDRILGVKPQEAVDRHKAMLKAKADAQSMDKLRKRHVDELKQTARENRLDVKIEADFDD